MRETRGVLGIHAAAEECGSSPAAGRATEALNDGIPPEDNVITLDTREDTRSLVLGVCHQGALGPPCTGGKVGSQAGAAGSRC